jgi:hypothetical protein
MRFAAHYRRSPDRLSEDEVSGLPRFSTGGRPPRPLQKVEFRKPICARPLKVAVGRGIAAAHG